MSGFDFHDALIQIEMLFQSHIIHFGYKEYSLETYADRRAFGEWQGREGCDDTDAMRLSLDIDGILRMASPSEAEVLTYLQYVLNIAELSRRSFNEDHVDGYDFDIRNFTELLSRCKELLKKLGYDLSYVPEKDYIYLVPSDPAAQVLTEDQDQPSFAMITEYRSFGMGGDLERKRQLLLELDRIVTDYPENKNSNEWRLQKRIDAMMKLLRVDPSAEGEGDVPSLSDAEKENWYDETFRLLLLRMLEHDNRERLIRIDRFAGENGLPIPPELTEEEMQAILSSKGDSLRSIPSNGEELPRIEVSADNRAVTGDDDGKDEDRPSKVPHPVRNVVIALVVADMLFVIFILCYLFL